MATILVRHKVGDIDAWLKGHQDRVALFAPAVSGFKTYQDSNDPANAAIKAEHTVLDPIIMSMPVDL
jgi:hypothetical protein